MSSTSSTSSAHSETPRYKFSLSPRARTTQNDKIRSSPPSTSEYIETNQTSSFTTSSHSSSSSHHQHSLKKRETTESLMKYISRKLTKEIGTYDDFLSLSETRISSLLSAHSCTAQIQKMRSAVKYSDWKLFQKKNIVGVNFPKTFAEGDLGEGGINGYIRRVEDKNIIYLKVITRVPVSIRVLHSFLLALYDSKSDLHSTGKWKNGSSDDVGVSDNGKLPIHSELIEGEDQYRGDYRVLQKIKMDSFNTVLKDGSDPNISNGKDDKDGESVVEYITSRVAFVSLDGKNGYCSYFDCFRKDYGVNNDYKTSNGCSSKHNENGNGHMKENKRSDGDASVRSSAGPIALHNSRKNKTKLNYTSVAQKEGSSNISNSESSPSYPPSAPSSGNLTSHHRLTSKRNRSTTPKKDNHNSPSSSSSRSSKSHKHHSRHKRNKKMKCIRGNMYPSGHLLTSCDVDNGDGVTESWTELTFLCQISPFGIYDNPSLSSSSLTSEGRGGPIPNLDSNTIHQITNINNGTETSKRDKRYDMLDLVLLKDYVKAATSIVKYFSHENNSFSSASIPATVSTSPNTSANTSPALYSVSNPRASGSPHSFLSSTNSTCSSSSSSFVHTHSSSNYIPSSNKNDTSSSNLSSSYTMNTSPTKRKSLQFWNKDDNAGTSNSNRRDNTNSSSDNTSSEMTSGSSSYPTSHSHHHSSYTIPTTSPSYSHSSIPTSPFHDANNVDSSSPKNPVKNSPTSKAGTNQTSTPQTAVEPNQEGNKKAKLDRALSPSIRWLTRSRRWRKPKISNIVNSSKPSTHLQHNNSAGNINKGHSSTVMVNGSSEPGISEDDSATEGSEEGSHTMPIDFMRKDKEGNEENGEANGRDWKKFRFQGLEDIEKTYSGFDVNQHRKKLVVRRKGGGSQEVKDEEGVEN